MPSRQAVAERTAVDGRGRLSREVLAALAAPQKWLPCRLLYDERGSELFEQICALEEYYPTRTELAIMREYAPAMAGSMGSGCVLLEYGSGSSTKTGVLLDHLQQPAAYVPIDISPSALEAAAERLRGTYPALNVLPVCADYTSDYALPASIAERRPRVAYFPGSTIGNFNMDEAVPFLQGIARAVGTGGALLIGVDLHKHPSILERAYDDRSGVTAAFSRNILAHLNATLGATFDLGLFRHHSFYNMARGRIEIHLVSEREQTVRVAGEPVSFAAGESILTEVSYKYTLDTFALLAMMSGFVVEHVWCDRDQLFSVQLLRVV